MDLLCFCSVLCLLCLCARLFICAFLQEIDVRLKQFCLISLRQGLSEPEFYGDLVYKVGANNFSAQFIKITFHFKRLAKKINVLQRTSCLAVKAYLLMRW